MKFFSDWSWCYRPTTTGQTQQEPDAASLRVALVAAQERAAAGSCSRRKKKNAHWSPALSAISEEGSVSLVEKSDRRKDNSDKKVKVPSKSRSTAKVRSSFYIDESHDYYSRRNSMSLLAPAFSPTPFMF